MNENLFEVTILGWCGAFPRPGLATCGVMVRTGEGVLLLDCGSGTLGQYLRFGRGEEIGGVLLSHLHYDHMGDLGSLGYLVKHDLRLGLRRDPLPVFCPAAPGGILDALRDPCFRFSPVGDQMEFPFCGFAVRTKRLSHPVECYAYRLSRGEKSLCYFTDSAPLPGAAEFVDGADLLICEATSTEGSVHSTGIGHMTDQEAGTLAREGAAKQLCLYHLPSDGDLAAICRRASEAYGKRAVTPELQRSFCL